MDPSECLAVGGTWLLSNLQKKAFELTQLSAWQRSQRAKNSCSAATCSMRNPRVDCRNKTTERRALEATFSQQMAFVQQMTGIIMTPLQSLLLCACIPPPASPACNGAWIGSPTSAGLSTAIRPANGKLLAKTQAANVKRYGNQELPLVLHRGWWTHQERSGAEMKSEPGRS